MRVNMTGAFGVLRESDNGKLIDFFAERVSCPR